MKISIVQPRVRRLDEEWNLNNIENMIESSVTNTDIILLPELFHSGYLFLDKKEVEGISVEFGKGRLFEWMKNISEKYDCGVCGGFAEKTDNGIYNSMAFVYKDQMELYRKIHLFYKEKDFFLPGDIPFFVFEYKNVRLGMMICFDWFFPESIRTLSLQGADIILHSANLVLPYCQDAMITRSIENRVFICTSNRIGCDKGQNDTVCFTGRSQVVAPGGKILFRMEKDKEDVITVDINPEESRNKAINEKNDLFSDRRPEMYKL